MISKTHAYDVKNRFLGSPRYFEAKMFDDDGMYIGTHRSTCIHVYEIYVYIHEYRFAHAKDTNQSWWLKQNSSANSCRNLPYSNWLKDRDWLQQPEDGCSLGISRCVMVCAVYLIGIWELLYSRTGIKQTIGSALGSLPCSVRHLSDNPQNTVLIG